MQTSHITHIGDARSLSAIDSDSIELVVTSPPYPMIEMWDDVFTSLNEAIGTALQSGNGEEAFELMHTELDTVWDELSRVVIPNGIVCINIGDATRKLDTGFELHPNHARIIQAFRDRGFSLLPSILWRKPTNSAAKFMGSGMLPVNQYVTLEHEHILVFRNGSGTRDGFSFDPEFRSQSAYFYEERNKWFTDMWSDVKGESQALSTTSSDSETRTRSAAYPFEIPYRLINMYSVYGDTVCDPFVGTGTTQLAAMVAARNSVGYEIDASIAHGLTESIPDLDSFSNRVISNRIQHHVETVEQQVQQANVSVEDMYSYFMNVYDLPVRSKNEVEMQFYTVTETDVMQQQDYYEYDVTHSPVTDIDSLDCSSVTDQYYADTKQSSFDDLL